MDLKVRGFEGVDWIHLAYDGDLFRAFVNAIMKLRVPKRQGIS
jgi:hypothetical protein